MLTLRTLTSDDSLDALTSLLHRPYAGLETMGLNDTAVDQSTESLSVCASILSSPCDETRHC